MAFKLSPTAIILSVAATGASAVAMVKFRAAAGQSVQEKEVSVADLISLGIDLDGLSLVRDWD